MYVIQREVRSGVYRTIPGLLFKRAASATKTLTRLSRVYSLKLKRGAR